MTVFTLGTITFNNGVADGDGITWYGYVDGWDTLENNVEDYARPGQHGGITTANQYAPRQMSVIGTGTYDTSSSLYYTAKQKLNANTNALTQFASSPLVITHTEDIVRRIECFRTSLRTQCKADVACEFELTVRCDDPRKYANVESSLVNSGTANNQGDIETFPTFTLSAAGAPTLTLGTRTVEATASLPSGTVIDFSDLTVLNGATDYFYNMDPASDFFGLAPGGNAVTTTVNGTWAWRSAWL